MNTSRSPGLQRLVAHFGGKEPFKEVAEDIEVAAGIRISAKDAERVSERIGEEIEQWDSGQRDRLRVQEPPEEHSPKTIETLYIEIDGTGVPMVPREVEGRKGKQADGSARSREAKLGCAFTQTTVDDEGRPVRDPVSSTFTGAIENAEAFGWRIFAEAVRRGLYNAQRVIVLSDGAEWIRTIVEMHFPGAVHIIDFYHVKERVHDLAKLIFHPDPHTITRYRDRWWELLQDGHIETIIAEAKSFVSKDHNGFQQARTHIGYLEKNKRRMRYAWCKAQHLFIGSGVVEAACKSVIGKRLKQSGMEWSVRGANAILALRCAKLSRRYEDFWEQRAA